MNAATTKTLTFDEFLQWKPENGHYELHEGIIIKMQPTGKHEEIVEFLQTELTLEARKKQYPFRFPKNVLIKALNGESGYLPDVLVMQCYGKRTVMGSIFDFNTGRVDSLSNRSRES